MAIFPCSYLGAQVESTNERGGHIAARHPELSEEAVQRIERTICDPDEVRVDPRFPRTRLFSRWFDDLLKGKILVVAVVRDEPESSETQAERHWVVTAYATRRLTKGAVEWSRP